MGYKFTKEQLIALARERGLYPPDEAADEELKELRAKQEAAMRKLELKYAHRQGPPSAVERRHL